jgi:hypothetical protein
MSIDPKYGAEVALLVKTMKGRLEGVPIRHPEIEDLIKLKRDNPLFHRVISAAIAKLNQERFPTIKARASRKANIPGGMVRISANEVPQRAYDKQTKGHYRVANNAIADLNTVDITALSEEEQVLVHSVHVTASLAQRLVTEDTRDRLKDEIRRSGKLDTQALVRLLQHNLQS